MKPVATGQKLRGGYYTPPAIAAFLASWAIRSPTTTMLEPSCGDGNFLIAAVDRFRRLGASDREIVQLIRAVELDPGESRKASLRLEAAGGDALSIHTGDFF